MRERNVEPANSTLITNLQFLTKFSEKYFKHSKTWENVLFYPINILLKNFNFYTQINKFQMEEEA